MAKDLMGELGLDTSEFEKALDRAADKVGNRFTGALGKATGALKGIGAALGIAFSVKKLADYVKTFQNLHAEIQKTRESLAAGSVDAKNFGEAVNSVKGGEASGFAYKRVGQTISNFLTTFKEKASLMGRQLAEGMTRNPNPLAGDNTTAATKEMQAKDVYDQETVDRGKKIVELQHESVIANGQDLTIASKQLEALEAEAKLQFEIMEYASRQGIADEAMRASAVRGYAAANTAHQNLQLQMRNELALAKATTSEMELQRMGYAEAGKLAKTIAEYDAKILQAQREGKGELAKQLGIQRNIAIQDAAIAEHNLTPAERRAERTAARKRGRDVRKTERHNADLEDRLNRMQAEGHAPTPGSELDRFARGRAALHPHGNRGGGGSAIEAAIGNIQGDVAVIKNNTANMFLNR